MKALYRQFRATIKRHRFILEKDSLLAGVSGGVDSMVLAHLLVQLQKDIDFRLSLAHVNYGLRGKESEAQEKLVREFAKENNLSCFVTQARLSPKSPENFQSMARDFRYHYFAEVANQIGAAKVAMAHHLEDQVETILAQWLRGSSLRGLGGMRPEREIRNPKSEIRNPRLVRPLLSFSKDQLLHYAKQEQIPFLHDSSNASPKYWRNRIRQELLPVIQNLRPGAFQKITKLGEEIQGLSLFLEAEAKKWLKDYGRKTLEGYWLPRPGWLKLPRPLRLEVLHQAVLESNGSVKNLKRDHLVRCEQLSLGLKTEGCYHLPQDLKFMRSGDDLLLRT